MIASGAPSTTWSRNAVFDHATDEARREDADAAVIEEIDPQRRAALLERRVVAEMRIAVDHAVTRERQPPRLEHRLGDAIARLQIALLVREKFLPFEPFERKQAACRKF